MIKTSQHVTLGGDIRGQQRETRFIWQGLRLLQEITPDGTPLTYVYSDQGSYEPLARIEGKQQRNIVYYHCLPNGMPEQVTDAEGTLCWQGNSNSWGKQLWERSDIDGKLQYEQNLRLQGHILTARLACIITCSGTTTQTAAGLPSMTR
jgi:uncharacterized protein RhaS with RHS repeats